MKSALYKLETGAGPVPVRFVRARNAKRYILRMLPGNIARVTIPRGGSVQHGWEFVRRHSGWLQKQLTTAAADWADGTPVYFRGTPLPLNIETNEGGPNARLAGHEFPLAAGLPVRRQVEAFLARLAVPELFDRTRELAAAHQAGVRRIRIGNQRTRWGSCSNSKTVSLNWRLIQTPDFVRDYIIIHELMHLREMNHSPRFWEHVAAACPEYREAEGWLRKHSQLLR